MKRAEVQLPDPLYQQVSKLADQLHVSVPELLCRAAEQLVERQPIPCPKQAAEWRLPEGRHLGAFIAPEEEWRTLANDDG